MVRIQEVAEESETAAAGHSFSSTLGNMVSLVYLHQVLDILAQSAELKQTAWGIGKQVAFAAGGCAVGGALGGPAGGLLGAAFGALAGYALSDDYRSLLSVVRGLHEEEKLRVQQKIQSLVGSASIEQFVSWLQSDGNRQTVLGLLSEAAKRAF